MCLVVFVDYNAALIITSGQKGDISENKQQSYPLTLSFFLKLNVFRIFFVIKVTFILKHPKRGVLPFLLDINIYKYLLTLLAWYRKNINIYSPILFDIELLHCLLTRFD
jgi:hypothetical protein